MVGWKYAKTILQNWLKAGIKTIEQVEAEEMQFKQQKQQPKFKNTKQFDSDIETQRIERILKKNGY